MRLPGVELTVRNGVKTVVNRTGYYLFYSFEGESYFCRVDPNDFEALLCDDFNHINFMLFLPQEKLMAMQYLAAVKNIRSSIANLGRELDR